MAQKTALRARPIAQPSAPAMRPFFKVPEYEDLRERHIGQIEEICYKRFGEKPLHITLIKSQLSDFDARAVFRVEFEKAKGRVGSPSRFLYFKTRRGFSFEAEFHGSVFIKALGGMAPATLWVEDFFIIEGLPGISGDKIFEQADHLPLAKEFGSAMAYAYAAGLADRAPDNFVLMEDKSSETRLKIANIDLTTTFQRIGSLEEVFNVLERLLIRKKSEHALNRTIAASFIDSFHKEFTKIKEKAAGLKFDFKGYAQQKIEQALAHIAAANPQTLRKQLLNHFQQIKPK